MRKRRVILQYERKYRRIPIERLYAITAALSLSITDLILVSSEKLCLENEEKEILNLITRYKKINDQDLRKMFCLLTKFVQISEKSSRQAEKIKIAEGLIKKEISIGIVSKTIGLFADKYVEEKVSSICYQIGKKIKEWKMVRKYTQEGLAKKMGIIRYEISNYEQGRIAVRLDKLYEMTKALSINIMDLFELTEDVVNSDKVENKLPNLIEEYKKIESQELRHALVKFLFEGVQICEEEVRIAEKIKVAKDLVKEGVSVDIILQIIGLFAD